MADEKESYTFIDTLVLQYFTEFTNCVLYHQLQHAMPDDKIFLFFFQIEKIKYIQIKYLIVNYNYILFGCAQNYSVNFIYYICKFPREIYLPS